MLSEEAAEARNKFYRNDRLFHARKTSRLDNMTDVFNRQLDKSDPFLSSLRINERIKKQKQQTLPAEVQEILLIQNTEQVGETTEAETNDEMNLFMNVLDEFELSRK